jgi:crotonobetainyl-CoA:carnitine CoA-transferase CaiB-like acyl-CoA transferase
VPQSQDRQTRGALDGVVICDLSTVLAGPYCTMLLADLGADVIKVEPPSGDPTRLYGPPYAAAPADGQVYGPGDPRSEPGYPGESAYYLSVNRNKRGTVLDLRTDAGRDVLRRLLAKSDVVVENFRAGAFARMGFADEALREINPRLIHLAITGYGPAGPDAGKPGFDFIIQAVSGLMSITGMPDDEGGRPTKVGVAITDVATGMLGAVSVLAALRARDTSDGPSAGRGQRIDLSLLDSTIAWLINQAGNHLVGGGVPGRMGNRHPNITPYETFRCADGEIAVAVGSERQWLRFCQALGLGDLEADPRFATNADRVRNRDALKALLEPRFASAPAAAWLAALEAAEVPSGRVRDLGEVLADPQVLANDMVATLDHPTAGQIRVTGVPFKLSETPASVRTPPPLQGEQTDEILGWLGYDADEVAGLRHGGGVK